MTEKSRRDRFFPYFSTLCFTNSCSKWGGREFLIFPCAKHMKISLWFATWTNLSWNQFSELFINQIKVVFTEYFAKRTFIISNSQCTDQYGRIQVLWQFWYHTVNWFHVIFDSKFLVLNTEQFHQYFHVKPIILFLQEKMKI